MVEAKTDQADTRPLHEVTFESDESKYKGTVMLKPGSAEGSEQPALTEENCWKHGIGIEVNKAEGTSYQGNFKQGKHHGKGTLVYEATGDCYEGDWVEGEIQGEGKFIFSNGDVYEGEFVNNAMKQGVLNKANGDEYAGDFVDDLYHGYSLYNYANGDSYCGDFLKGKRHGNGVLRVKASGLSYAGRFEEGQLLHGQVKTNEGEYLGQFAPDTLASEGRGIMKFTNGDVYDGKWKNGLQHGHGTLIYAKLFADDSSEEAEEGETEKQESITSMYVGTFENGSRKEGTLTYENGDTYTGTFTSEGLRESGGIKYVNGDEFVGLFVEGSRQCGILTFTNGDVYSGEFREHLFHGGGKMTYAGGDEYSGEFANGQKHGSGQLTIAMKKGAKTLEEVKSAKTEGDAKEESKESQEDDAKGVYIGEFFEDEMSGNGTFLFPDGTEYIGRFKNGLQHGQGLLKLKDGTEMLGRWEHGQQTQVEYSIDLHEPEAGEGGAEQPVEESKVESEVEIPAQKDGQVVAGEAGQDTVKQEAEAEKQPTEQDSEKTE